MTYLKNSYIHEIKAIIKVTNPDVNYDFDLCLDDHGILGNGEMLADVAELIGFNVVRINRISYDSQKMDDTLEDDFFLTFVRDEKTRVEVRLVGVIFLNVSVAPNTTVL